MAAHGIRIRGLVQGVFFRDQTKAKADALGIAGWVRNADDGSVEIHAEGSEEVLEKLEEWCRVGPPAARVDRVETRETETEGKEGFEILW